jgi:hypothetical protein
MEGNVSAMETYEKDRREHWLRYAPKRPSDVRDDGSILPILQRLSRGDDAEYDASVVAAPAAARVDAEPQKEFYWTLLVCSVMSAGVSAALVFLAIGWFGSGATDDRQVSAINPNPKYVQTVSFKQANNQTVSVKQNKISDPPPLAGGETRVAKDQPTESAQDKPAALPKLESAPSSDASAEQTPTPWAAKSVSLSSHGWQEAPPVENQESSPVEQASSPADVETSTPSETAGTGEASDADAPSPSRPVAARHHSRRAHARSRTHHARRHAPRQAQAEPPPSTETAAQPSSNPWQSTWQTLFGHPRDASNGPSRE